MLKDFADLHLHTIFSDGFSTPAIVLKNAYRYRFKAISITDHDTIDGVALSISEGCKYGIEVIPGIELSSSMEDRDIHLLGYFVDYKDTIFQKILDEVKEKRRLRLKKMVNNLDGMGMHVDFDKLLEFAGPGTVGRLHLAHFLYKNKIVSHIHEAFDKYIGHDKPAYEKVNAFSPKEAIELISNTGGIPVWAHPEHNCFDALINPLISMGLKGIEVYQSKNKEKDSLYFLDMAHKYNLLITGGSDCHGAGKLSPSIGKVRLPYKYVNELKESAGINCPMIL